MPASATPSSAGSAAPPIVVVMGVSGSGKTSVGRCLATILGGRFLDADDLHPPANVRKMSAGEPLTDTDRTPWLDAVGRAAAAAQAPGGGVVVACSALKRAYRDRLRALVPTLELVWLTGPTPLIRRRLAARTGHFMPPSLLESQLATLEPPTAGERPIVANITPPAEEIAAWIADTARRRLPRE